MNIQSKQHIIKEFTKQSQQETAFITELGHDATQQGMTISGVLDIEIEALKTLIEQDGALLSIEAKIKLTLDSGCNIILLGCGASGRVAMIVKRFVQQCVNDYLPRIKAVMAGGDVAFVSAIEQFEDSTAFVQKQLDLVGYKEGDLIIGLSASGRANFVLSAVEIASQAGRGLLVTNANVEAIKTKGFKVPAKNIISIKTCKPALAGSTRMHPATLQFCICRILLKCMRTDYLDYVKHINNLTKWLIHIKTANLTQKITNWINFETDCYQNENKIEYKVNHKNNHASPSSFAMSIFQDCTERSPTFNLPADGPADISPKPWARVSFDLADSEAAWSFLLGSNITDLNLPQFEKTSTRYRLQCDFSRNGTQRWKATPNQQKLNYKTIYFDFSERHFIVKLPDETLSFDMSLLSDFTQLIAIKIIMNTVSTCVMANCGLCQGNIMTNVKPANAKLLERSQRIIKQIGQRDNLGAEDIKSALLEEFMLSQGNSIIHPVLETLNLYNQIKPENSSFYIGTMSGTSMDGVDVSLLQTDGQNEVEQIAHSYVAYPHDFHQQMRMLELQIHQSHGDLSVVDAHFMTDVVDKLTRYHIKAIKKLLKHAKLEAKQIKAIGCHGQTFYHQPEKHMTHQLINADMLKNQLGIPVISKFRQFDVLMGGQGAPLAPVYHLALMNKLQKIPCIVINCGGIANATVLPTCDFDDTTAFDIGPGNVLLDRWVRIKTNFSESIDKDGKYSTKGKVNQFYLNKLMEHACLKKDYLALPLPKSLCTSDFVFPKGFESLSIEDGAATLVAYTVEMIYLSLERFNIKTWVLAGGGWKNPEITGALSKRATDINLISAEALNIKNDAIEADIFAYCTARKALGLPIFSNNNRIEITQQLTHT